MGDMRTKSVEDRVSQLVATNAGEVYATVSRLASPRVAADLVVALANGHIDRLVGHRNAIDKSVADQREVLSGLFEAEDVMLLHSKKGGLE